MYRGWGRKKTGGSSNKEKHERKKNHGKAI